MKHTFTFLIMIVLVTGCSAPANEPDAGWKLVFADEFNMDGWPGCGEIDIMEYYDDSILANACWSDGTRNPAWDTVKKPLADFGGKAWADKPHVWRMDWDAEKIQLYVDNILLNTIAIDKTIHPDLNITPFHEPHYILLNLAIGGNRGGDPTNTTFPSRYQIDYVHVWQK